MHNSSDKITAVILAGGRATRMGGEDKGLIKVSGRAMIEYVIAVLQSQLNHIVINANRNLESYAGYGLPVLSDIDDGFKGPLAGMASCMQQIDTEYLITAPCDSPFIADDYVQRMFSALQTAHADLAVADDGERLQPVFTLLNCKLLPSLLDYLNSGERKIDLWFKLHKLVRVDFSDKPQTFVNVNTPEDIREMEMTGTTLT